MKTNIVLVKIQDAGEEIHYSFLFQKLSKTCISFTLLVPGAIITTFHREPFEIDQGNSCSYC